MSEILVPGLALRESAGE
jgi:hypothetical protein